MATRMVPAVISTSVSLLIAGNLLGLPAQNLAVGGRVFGLTVLSTASSSHFSFYSRPV